MGDARLLDELRAGCETVAARARFVRLVEDAVAPYAALLPEAPPPPDPEAWLDEGDAEERAAFVLTLDVANFGSGWFPTLRKRPGRSGSYTIAIGFRERFAREGAWSAEALATITAAEVAGVLGQDPGHELCELQARALRGLGRHVAAEHGGRFAAVADGSAEAFVERVARWPCFADEAVHGDVRLPFLKRAQLAARDLAESGVAAFADLGRLTLLADNLVPHVLRLDGVLDVDPGVLERIERGDLLEHGSPEEVELRAVALVAVERIVAALGGRLPAAAVDAILWRRGQGARYKAVPRHRTRCTAY